MNSNPLDEESYDEEEDPNVSGNQLINININKKAIYQL